MRTVVPDYKFLRPDSVQDVLKLKAVNPQRRIFAGGTDLMVEVESGQLPSAEFIDIHNLQDLKKIVLNDESAFVGALVTYDQIKEHEGLVKNFPLLERASIEFAAPAIQNRGTIGGNVANGSPAADAPPVMLVYDCKVVLASIDGDREVDYGDFHQGYKKMDLRANELIKGFIFERPQEIGFERYVKVGTRKMQAISKVVFAGRGRLEKGKVADIRLAFGSVAPVPMRCKNLEKWLFTNSLDAFSYDKCFEVLKLDIAPIDDIRSTAGYRLSVACNLVFRFLSDLSKN